MDELVQIARQLRALLMERAATNVYALNSSDQSNVAGLHMAASLVELGVLVGRSIQPNEIHWFEGGTALARQMDDTGELGEQIFDLYLKLVAGVKARNYFRQA